MSIETPVKNIKPMVDDLRGRFNSNVSKSYDWRVKQLKSLIQMLTENKQTFMDAMTSDLQSILLFRHMEVDGSIKEAQYMLDHLKSLMADSPRSVPLTTKPGAGHVRKEPYGVALIMSPWNYPISLLMKPLAGALAAGNLVLVKPSEVSSAVSNVFASLLPKYLSESCACVTGGVAQATEVLKQRFDVIMYTGNTSVGRVVMRAAAEHLTPVLLELGGKSPFIVDESADLDVTARRLVWGKYVCNVGQTCVSPDYVLCHEKVKDQLVEKVKRCIDDFFGATCELQKECKDLSRVINARHVGRLQALLDPVRAHVVKGGESDAETRFFAPTVVVDVPFDADIMKEEIFGPILPIQTVRSMQEAVDIVNRGERPLALYVFTRNEANKRLVLDHTASGGVGVNEVVFHIVCPEMPFGGVGQSGMGNYNGKYSFDAFTHERSVLEKPFYLDSAMRYPPYTEKSINRLIWLGNLKLPLRAIFLGSLALVPLSAYVYYKYSSY